MPTPAVIPRSPFIPSTAQPPYSHVGNSTRAELDRLGLTALRFEVRGLILRVLDAFRRRGATWSGQVISSPPGPSRGPVMTHLLPGGGVPRVHRDWSPVPPRLPYFATPRSVRYLAAVAAGAYPLRRPPVVWSPGASAPPGPCYWLVASGTPVGWRGGCLALPLVRGAARHYCLGGCSALVVCARRSRPVRGAWAGAGCCVFPVSPFPPRVPRAVYGGPPVRVSLILARWYAIPCGLCAPRAPSGYPSGIPRVPFACVCARAPAVSALPPPPLVGVACAPRAVPVLGACRAVPRGPCFSACPAPVPCPAWFAFWGGGGPVPFPPYLAWGRVPPAG